MEVNRTPGGRGDSAQLKKYAEDMSAIYRAEKEKRRELEAANLQLKRYAEDLGINVSELKAANRELREAYLDTIHRLALAAEYKDEDTGDHIRRMSRYSALIAEKAGMPAADVQNMLYASPMHDVGKIGIPDSVLLKPATLTDEEYGIMRTHTTIGAKILANSKNEVLRLAAQIAVSHHERYGGRGYPQGLKRENIPLSGRIVAVADTFDALTSRRPYKNPYPVEIASNIIRENSGEQFDPSLVDVFLANIDEVLKIKAEVGLPEDVSLSDFTWSERDRAEGRGFL